MPNNNCSSRVKPPRILVGPIGYQKIKGVVEENQVIRWTLNAFLTLMLCTEVEEATTNQEVCILH